MRLRRWQPALVCLVVLALVLFAPARRGRAGVTSVYNVTDLGVLDGNQKSIAYALDSFGRVAGVSILNQNDTASARRPFLWDNSQQPKMADLGTLGGDTATASGLNNFGVAAGNSTNAAGDTHAFVWHDDNGNHASDPGEMKDLGTLGGDVLSSAYGVNDSGQVVGLSESAFLSDRAFVWSQATGMQLIASSNGLTPIAAYAINNAGQVVGVAAASSGAPHAYLLSGGTLTDLGTLGGRNSFAYGINEAGQVVGNAELPSNSASPPAHAFRWSPNSGSPARIDLGTLAGGTNSIAYDINSTGDVVGSSEVTGGATHAFVWHDADGDGQADPGEMKDLNTLLPPSSGWTLQEARSINDGGQIVGYGLFQPDPNQAAQTHAFLLTPTSFASSSLANVSGSGVYNSTATLTATLTSGGSALSNQTVGFTLNGTPVCGVSGEPACPATDASGVATLTGVSLSGINGGAYPNAVAANFSGAPGVAASSGAGQLTVDKATASLTLGNLTQTYDGSAKSATATTTPANLGVSISYSQGGQPVQSPTSAGSYDVAATVNDTNYQGSATGTLTINKATATLTLDSASLSQTYDGNAKAATATTTPPGLSGVTITYSQGGSPVAAPTNAGSYDVLARLNNPNYQANDAVGALVIKQAAATVTLGNLTQTFDGQPKSVTATTNPAGKTVNITYSQSNQPVTLIINAGVYDVTAKITDANYQGSATGQLTINKADQTINFAGPLNDKTYGDADFNVSATASSGLSVSFAPSGNCTINASLVHITGVGSCTITASQLGGTNYKAAPNVQQSFNIAKAATTTTVTVSNAVYDGNPHGGTASVTGPAGLSQSLTPSYSGRNSTTYGPSPTAPTGAGDYTASASYAGDSNYNASSDSKPYQIAKASQTITFGALADKTFGDADFAVSATASSGLSVSFSASGNCTVSGTTVHITGAGSCIVTASQAGDSNYNAATPVPQSFNIGKANQTITFGALADRRFGFPDFPVSATGGASGNPVTFSATDNCTIVNGNTVHLTGAGSCSVTASQAGDSNFNAAASVTRSFNIGKASVIISLPANPSVVGQAVAFSATVVLDRESPPSPTAIPTGNVQFSVDGQALGGPVLCVPAFGVSCVANSITTSALSAGSHGIRADYSGDANFNPSSIQVPQTVSGSTISFSQSSYTVAERDGSITINVTRTGDTTQAASVDYFTDDGSTPSVAVACSAVTGLALERCDYTRAAGTLRFAPGETQKSFTVLVNDDSYAEGTETLTLRLENPTANAAVGQPVVLQITDDSPESTGNPADDASFFVRQHYHDFLNREPDAAGLQFWTGGITGCGSDANCTAVKRINTSAAFFLSIEFQDTGYVVERIYKTAFGDSIGNSTFPGPHQLAVPVVRLQEFLRDTQEIGSTPTQVIVGQGNWQQQLEDNKNAFALEFVARQRFAAAFPSSLTADQFVRRLSANAGGVLTEAEITQLDNLFGGPSASSDDAAKRAQALRAVAENPALNAAEKNRAFVLMQFFGYLRRNPNDAQDTDYTGYDFWLQKLDQFGGDFVKAEMVKAFITSTEYRQRFGEP